jgi:hypothetical protein
LRIIKFSFCLLKEKKYIQNFLAELHYAELEPGEIWIHFNLNQHGEKDFLFNYIWENRLLPLSDWLKITNTETEDHLAKTRKLEIDNAYFLRIESNHKGKKGSCKLGISQFTIKCYFNEPFNKKETHQFFLTKAGDKVCGQVSSAFYEEGKWQAYPRSKYAAIIGYKYLFTHTFSHEEQDHETNRIIKQYPTLKIKTKESSIKNIHDTADILSAFAGFLRDDNIKIFRYEVRINNELTVTVKERDNSYNKVTWRFNCNRGMVDDFIGDIKIKKEIFINKDFWIKCFSSFVSTRKSSPENRFLVLYNIIEILNDYYERNNKISKIPICFEIDKQKKKEFNKLCHSLIENLAPHITAKRNVKKEREIFLETNQNIEFKRELLKKKGYLNYKIERLINYLDIDLRKFDLSDIKLLTNTRNNLTHGPNDRDYKAAEELNPNFGRLVNLIIVKTLNKEFNIN